MMAMMMMKGKYINLECDRTEVRGTICTGSHLPHVSMLPTV